MHYALGYDVGPYAEVAISPTAGVLLRDIHIKDHSMQSWFHP